MIVSVGWLERSMMPWIVASQTIPIIALAPMIVVILSQFNITGIAPKAAIAAYLCFFPITVGMVKGFRSPDPLHLDLMRTYSATRAQTFLKLRAPASAPFFFASMKVGAAAALVGAIVAEVTKSEDGGIGARLLAGSYYGQTVQIWAALFAAPRCRPCWSASSAFAGQVGRAAHGLPQMSARRFAHLVPPIVFGAAVLALWEAVVRIGGVPLVILPAPSAIVGALLLLAADALGRFRSDDEGRARGLCDRLASRASSSPS